MVPELDPLRLRRHSMRGNFGASATWLSISPPTICPASVMVRSINRCPRRRGAFLATYLGQAVGWYAAGQAAGFIGAVVGAIIILILYRLLFRRRA
jgi:hypothetical protein